jgi:hypothetical protein
MLFTPRVGLHMTYQQVVRTMARNQEPNEEMSEMIGEGTSTSLRNQLGALNRANDPPNIEVAIPSDVSALLERTSGLSLVEMDKAIQELQKARNFLRNERERLRLEIVEHLRLTQAAMSSAKAVSTSVASFGTVAGDFRKDRAAV